MIKIVNKGLGLIKDIDFVLNSKGISRDEFERDYKLAKQTTNSKNKSNTYFETKYNQLFDNSIRKYANFYNFDGSYRRAVNPNNLNKDLEIKKVQLEYRKINLVKKENIKDVKKEITKVNRDIKKIKEKKAKQEAKELAKTTKEKKIMTRYKTDNPDVLEKRIYNSISKMKDAWNYEKLKDYKWKAQQVQIKVNFDFEKEVIAFDKNGNQYTKIIREYDKFITVVSYLSPSVKLITLYEQCLSQLDSFVKSMNTAYSTLYINFLLVYTYRIGIGLR